MPTFQVLGKNFQIEQESLDKAPTSILAEAAALSRDQNTAAISLEAWPEPDLAIFEVSG